MGRPGYTRMREIAIGFINTTIFGKTRLRNDVGSNTKQRNSSGNELSRMHAVKLLCIADSSLSDSSCSVAAVLVLVTIVVTIDSIIATESTD